MKPLYSGLLRPNGLAFKNGTLYIAELNKILKVEKIEDNLENPPKPIVIYDDLPSDEAHGWKYLTFGPDDKLYFQVGAPCNICEPSDRHAQIRRINTDGSGVDVIARGIRQILGMDFHPVSKQLYFSENQRDWLSEELPNDKLNRLTQPGKEFRNIGDPRRRDRFMSTYELGVRSPFVVHGIAAYERAFKMLEDTLSEAGPWILGAGPSLADINLMPFAARLDYSWTPPPLDQRPAAHDSLVELSARMAELQNRIARSNLRGRIFGDENAWAQNCEPRRRDRR